MGHLAPIAGVSNYAFRLNILETGELLHDPTTKEKIDVCMLHMDRLIQLKGKRIAIKEMRKYAVWYLRGLKRKWVSRRLINGTDTSDVLLDILWMYVR